ncbi:hypothetical protein [Paenibacillus xylanexedens]|uniref:hypothetical protein n=2 Tax=Paenibacillus xylanexedens TaxID=528191 RepID=UPI003CFFC15E
MLKYIRMTFIFSSMIFILTGCGGISNSEEQDFYQKAIPIGQEYFKKYYDAEVEFTGFQTNLPMSSTMVLDGYVKDDAKTWVSLSFYLPSLEVKSASGPGEFIHKRKSEEEVDSP